MTSLEHLVSLSKEKLADVIHHTLNGTPNECFTCFDLVKNLTGLDTTQQSVATKPDVWAVIVHVNDLLATLAATPKPSVKEAKLVTHPYWPMRHISCYQSTGGS